MAFMYLPTIFLTLGMSSLLLHSVVELVFMVPNDCWCSVQGWVLTISSLMNRCGELVIYVILDNETAA